MAAGSQLVVTNFDAFGRDDDGEALPPLSAAEVKQLADELRLADEAADDATERSDDSDEAVEGAEKLLGRRRRWAPQRGTRVELSAEAASSLADDPGRFFQGAGTVRHVSLDGSEVQVEWDSRPGVTYGYPVGYHGRFHLRVYEPLLSIAQGHSITSGSMIPGRKHPGWPEGRDSSLSHNDAQQIAEARERRLHARAERERRRQEERARTGSTPSTAGSRLHSREGSQGATPSTADRRRLSAAKKERHYGEPPSMLAAAASPAVTASLSTRGRYLEENDPGRRIAGAHRFESHQHPQEALQREAHATLDRLIGAERQLEKHELHPVERSQILQFLAGLPKVIDDLKEIVLAGNIALTRCKRAAENEANQQPLNQYVVPVRTTFSLADNIAVILRRVRNLAYTKKFAPSMTGELPIVPEWGGKLKIQAEMEITKCVASAILLQKLRETNRLRAPTSGSETATLGKTAITNPQKERPPVRSRGNADENKPEGGNRTRQIDQDKFSKTNVEVLMEQEWNEEVSSAHPLDSPREDHDAVDMARRTRDDAVKFELLSLKKAQPRGHGELLQKIVDREFSKGVQNGPIKDRDGELFSAAHAAIEGGAGSVAVLLETLKMQRTPGSFLPGMQVDCNGEKENDPGCAARTSIYDDPDLQEGPKVIAATAMMKDEYVPKWKSSGPECYASHKIERREESWRRGKKRRDCSHDDVGSQGVCQKAAALRPAADAQSPVGSSAEFLIVAKSLTSEFKAAGLVSAETKSLVPEISIEDRKGPPLLPLAGKPLAKSGASPLDEDKSPQRRRMTDKANARAFQSPFLQEMHETMGPYLHRTCVRTPAAVDLNQPRVPASMIPGIRMQVRPHVGRPQTRDFQQNLLSQIEHRTRAYAQNVDHQQVLSSPFAASVQASLYRGWEGFESETSGFRKINFERGLTPKLARQGHRSRSVMGTSDTGFKRL